MKSQILDAFFNGQCSDAYKFFGAHQTFENANGVRFNVYAPNAQSIQLIGEFNDWNGSNHCLDKIDNRGIWSIFVEGLSEGDLYKYQITQDQGQMVDKMDPYAFESELRPNNASRISNSDYAWKDAKWLNNRSRGFDKPISIYEVHLGAWKIGESGVNYKQIAKELVSYVKRMHYTHVEFMPLSEYPFDGSWGYQVSGYFCATSRYGSLKELKYLIDCFHQENIAVLFDFIPVHFVSDDHALRKFDGTNLYEYQSFQDASSEWGSMNFDLHKESVRSFLISAASYWLRELHGDGLRMDAVSNMIYWQGNKDRGVNEGALTFIRRINYILHNEFKEVMLIAEDSSDFQGVTKSTLDYGLGFDYKWDLGWMNDTLSYFSLDPIFRKDNHNKINFSMAYFYSEKFLLPFSHDEVVHGKCSIVNKMWGTYEQKFSQARLLYMYMYMHPGKKLNFMGNEIGHMREFDENISLDWFLLKYPMHDSFHRFIEDLQQLYQSEPALYEDEYNMDTFEWIDADNANENLYSFVRKSSNTLLIGIFNMSPNTYLQHPFGVQEAGVYSEQLNSERDIYTGCHIVNDKEWKAIKKECNYLPYRIEVDVAPFGGIIIKHTRNKKINKIGDKND